MSDVYLSIGTNQGDRSENIRTALRLLDGAFGTTARRVSDIIETESWGFEAPDFLNCAALYSVELSPEAVLKVCKDIENQMGRKEIPEYDGNGDRIYHSRIIDIDILFYGTQTVDTENLKIPHPLMKKRNFVMIPLRQIAEQTVKDAFPHIFD